MSLSLTCFLRECIQKYVIRRSAKGLNISITKDHSNKCMYLHSTASQYKQKRAFQHNSRERDLTHKRLVLDPGPQNRTCQDSQRGFWRTRTWRSSSETAAWRQPWWTRRSGLAEPSHGPPDIALDEREIGSLQTPWYIITQDSNSTSGDSLLIRVFHSQPKRCGLHQAPTLAALIMSNINFNYFFK